MKRSELRELIFLLVFRMDCYTEPEMEEQIDYVISQETLTEEEQTYVRDKVAAIRSLEEDIDKKINSRAEHWKTTRMNRTDLAVLRLALYEILHEEAIPTAVSINEAVNIAKQYGDDKSGSFVNGILAKFA